MSEKYEKYRQIKGNIADLGNIHAVLAWDMETNMPTGGMEFRGRQISTLAGIIHDLSISSEMGDLLHALSDDESLGPKEKRNVKESLRIYERESKLDNAFVVRFSKVISDSYQAWMKARAENNYSIFAPKLKEVFELSREKAEKYTYKSHPYDALLDEFEPGLTTAKVEEVFIGVKEGLGKFLEKIKHSVRPDMQVMEGPFDISRQEKLCRIMATDMGFDWNNGRLDISEHPFTTSFNPFDVRITTRYKENNLLESVWGVIHETGHALYEQGLPAEEYGLPSGEPISLAIHESQSRLWENNVGKSSEYIGAYWETFKEYFPANFYNYTDNDFFKALNNIQPNLIRTDSDEVTYHFHILLRYEIEKGLIEGNMQVQDLESIWNQKIKDYLGLEVPSPKMGVLQDIHWSHGSIGYFPTYSLGTFYAAQFFAAANKAIPDLQGQISKREFHGLLGWLRENIHKYGHQYSSEELCHKVSGEGLSYKYFDDYIHTKYAKVYNL